MALQRHHCSIHMEKVIRVVCATEVEGLWSWGQGTCCCGGWAKTSAREGLLEVAEGNVAKDAYQEHLLTPDKDGARHLSREVVCGTCCSVSGRACRMGEDHRSLLQLLRELGSKAEGGKLALAGSPGATATRPLHIILQVAQQPHVADHTTSFLTNACPQDSEAVVSSKWIRY